MHLMGPHGTNLPRVCHSESRCPSDDGFLRSCLFPSILTRTPWLLNERHERNVFFAYKLSVPPLAYFSRVEGGRGSGFVGRGTYTRHDVAERFSPATIDVCCMLNQTSRILTHRSGLSGHTSASFTTVIIYSLFQSTQPITDRRGKRRGKDEDEGQIRYVINRLVPKTVQRTSTQQNTGRHQAETERRRK